MKGLWMINGGNTQNTCGLSQVQSEFEALHIWYDNEENLWTYAQ